MGCLPKSCTHTFNIQSRKSVINLTLTSSSLSYVNKPESWGTFTCEIIGTIFFPVVHLHLRQSMSENKSKGASKILALKPPSGNSNNLYMFQLIDTQEHHSLSYLPLLQHTLQLCYTYLFTSQGQGTVYILWFILATWSQG